MIKLNSRNCSVPEGIVSPLNVEITSLLWKNSSSFREILQRPSSNDYISCSSRSTGQLSDDWNSLLVKPVDSHMLLTSLSLLDPSVNVANTKVNPNESNSTPTENVRCYLAFNLRQKLFIAPLIVSHTGSILSTRRSVVSIIRIRYSIVSGASGSSGLDGSSGRYRAALTHSSYSWTNMNGVIGSQ